MKLLQIYNQYRSLFGGEETVLNQIDRLARKSGFESTIFMKSSRRLDQSLFGKIRAFFSGIYNPFSRIEAGRFVRRFQPDIVHVHNLFPLFSPSVLGAIRASGTPIVMTVHNHFHTCPTADHLHDGRICERCLGRGREINCLLQNCRGHALESLGYALRSATARVLRLYVNNVAVVIALNEFAKGRLETAGFDPDRIEVLPNMVELNPDFQDCTSGQYVLFSGRMCPEKGVSTLLEAARQIPDIPFRLAGGGPTFEDHKRDAPPNVQLLGQLSAAEMSEAYAGARFLVIPSRWFEGCPLVISEAMNHGLPVIASRIGGLPELVEENVTGLLFEPGNSQELAKLISRLWMNDEACRKMGLEGRAKAVREFSEEVFWTRLREIYERAIGLQSEAANV